MSGQHWVGVLEKKVLGRERPSILWHYTVPCYYHFSFLPQMAYLYILTIVIVFKDCLLSFTHVLRIVCTTQVRNHCVNTKPSVISELKY